MTDYYGHITNTRQWDRPKRRRVPMMFLFFLGLGVIAGYAYYSGFWP